MIVLVLLLLFLALLAFEDERVARYRYVDVLSIETRQFHGDLIGIVIFAQIDRRRGECERGCRAPRRLDFEHASQRRKTNRSNSRSNSLRKDPHTSGAVVSVGAVFFTSTGTSAISVSIIRYGRQRVNFTRQASRPPASQEHRPGHHEVA